MEKKRDKEVRRIEYIAITINVIWLLVALVTVIVTIIKKDFSAFGVATCITMSVATCAFVLIAITLIKRKRPKQS